MQTLRYLRLEHMASSSIVRLEHSIDELASMPSYARLHGPEGAVVDASETPSQLLEY